MKRRGPVLAGFAALLAAAAALPWYGSDYALAVGLSLLMWTALTESWALLSGLSGYVSLGHAVFYGIGAYVMVLCWPTVPLPLAVLLAGLAAGALALVLGWPCLRVRGPYFVILTFGVAEFVKFVVIAVESALGRTGRLLFGTPSLAVLFEAMLVLAALSAALLHLTRRARLGRGLLAIREDETAAEAIGIDATVSKLTVFALSAVIPGMVGSLMVLRSTYFEAMQAFSPVTSFTIVTIGILGGSDDAPGPLLGAAVLVLLSELLSSAAPEIYMVLLGMILVGFVLFVPEGLFGRIRSLRR